MKALLTGSLCWLLALPLQAQWSSDPSVNTLVRNSAAYDNLQSLVPDGQGGAIFIMQRSPDSLLAQRISQEGELLWGPTEGGKLIKLVNANEDLDEVVAIPDGAGGVIVGWVIYPPDSDFSEIFLQRLSADGLPLWGSGGVQVATAASAANFSLGLCSDSAGGVYAAWTQTDWLSYFLVFMQRVNAAGQKQWGTGGLNVCQASGLRAMGGLGTDASGAAVVFFSDTRNDPTAEQIDIYGQRISAAGEWLWGNSGLPVCVAAGYQYVMPYLLPDGAGGMIAFFEDYRNDVPVDGSPTNTDIYAQRTNANGSRLWGEGGKPVCTIPDLQYPATAVALGNGAAAVTWTYGPTWLENRTYAQCMDGSGNVLWASAGLLLTGTAEMAGDHSITTDAAGNLQVAFVRLDFMSGSSEVRAQKVNAAGMLQWGSQGTLVCNRADAGKFNPMIVPSKGDAAIVAWMDGRNEATSMDDIYAAKVLSDGSLASGPVVLASIAPGDWNNPAIWAGGQVPGETARVVIRHQVTVTAGASCLSVRVEAPGGQLRINPGISFKVLQ